MPSKPNKVTERWNPGSTSAVLAEAAAAPSSTVAGIAKNPAAKNDTFVSEGSVKDRLSMWGAKKQTKPTITATTMKLPLKVDRPAKVQPSSSSPSQPISSKKSTVLLLSSSNHSTESVQSLTGGSSHRDRLAAWGKATQSMSRLSGYGVAKPSMTKAAQEVTAPVPAPAQLVQPPAPTSRASLLSRSRGAKSMSNVASIELPSSSIPKSENVQVGGLSVKDRMKEWGGSKKKTTASVDPPTSERAKDSAAAEAAASFSETFSLQKSKSTDTNTTLEITSTASDGEPAAASTSGPINAQPWKSPPPSYANRTLKQITPPQEDKHKHQSFSGNKMPDFELKKVERPVEDKHKQHKNLLVGALLPTVELKKVALPRGTDKSSHMEKSESPSLYSTKSLRNIGKPNEEKTKQAPVERPSLYSSISLRNVGKPETDVKGHTAESTSLPAITLKSIAEAKEDMPAKDVSTSASELYTSSKLKSVKVAENEAISPDLSATSRTENSPVALSDMPTGEKTKEMSPILTPASAPPASEEITTLKSAELTLQDLPLESPENAPKVPPSPLEVLIKENVLEAKNNKLLMLMSSMSGRQDQKTAQDRALTILKGLQVGPDEMELVDGADPIYRERRNVLFKISGIRAQYPQFFLVDNQGKTSFLCDWDSFEMMNDSGHLGESMNLGMSMDSM